MFGFQSLSADLSAETYEALKVFIYYLGARDIISDPEILSRSPRYHLGVRDVIVGSEIISNPLIISRGPR